MRVKGEVVLRGKRYDVDCYNVRDRSWGKPRPEDSMPLPPLSWVTAVFNDDFAFNCNVFDQVSGNPELKGQFALPEENTLNGGWLLRDGKVGQIVKARKSVARAPRTFIPVGVELEFTDEFDRRIEVSGKLQAHCFWQTWGNALMGIGMMRWECEGMVTYGDCQEPFWSDYLHAV